MWIIFATEIMWLLELTGVHYRKTNWTILKEVQSILNLSTKTFVEPYKKYLSQFSDITLKGMETPNHI